MTIASSTNKTSPFAGNDTTGPWAFTFKTLDEADLEVIKLVSGVESVLVLNTDYTVSLNGDQEASPGGDITTTANVATGETLVIRRVVEALQGVDLVQGGAFNPSVIETALDRLTMLAQQLGEEVDRSVKVALTSGDDPDALVASIAASEAAAAASEAAAAASEAAAAASESSAAGYAASINPAELILRDGSVAMTGQLKLAAGADIASATTLDLTAATGNLVRITGTTATTAVTLNNGQYVVCYAVGAWPLTYHATNLPLPGSANYTCAAGDMVIFSKDGNGEIHIEIVKRDGTAVAATVGLTDGTWTDYSATSTIVGFSSYTTKLIYYKDIGKTRFVTFVLYGTSNSTSTSFTLPNASTNDIQIFVKTRAIDNGVENTSGGMLLMQPNTSTVTGYTAAAGAWTASGTKMFAGQFTYQLP